MIYELRQYRIRPGRLDDCHRMFREVVLPVFDAIGIRSIGYWEPAHKGEFDLHCIVAFDSAEARERLWEEFSNHPDWQAERARWQDGPPYEMTKSTLMTATDYSPGGSSRM